jgi:hypothetical protein
VLRTENRGQKTENRIRKSEGSSMVQSAWSMGEKAKMEGYNRTGLSAKLKLIGFFFPPLVGGIEGGG